MAVFDIYFISSFSCNDVVVFIGDFVTGSWLLEPVVKFLVRLLLPCCLDCLVLFTI